MTTRIVAILFVVALMHGARSALAQQVWPGRVTFVGNDNQIYFCSGECARPECLTCQIAGADDSASYSLPTYSPDARKLAFISTSARDRPHRFGLIVYDFQRRVAVRAFDSADMAPIYLYWLPDSKSISFLAKEPLALSLVVVDADAPGPARIVNTGTPFYFEWNSLGTGLALHITSIYDHMEQVALANADNRDQKRVVAAGPLSFRTPAWSPDHRRLAYCSFDKGRFMLTVADADGANPKVLVTLPPAGENAFVWAPDSYHIAYTSSPVKGVPIFGGIKLIDVVNNTARKMTGDAVMGFFFSPDGKQLAFVSLPPDKSYASWKIVEIESAITRPLCDFAPTPDDSMAYEHFDQYSLSHNIWSPDSRALVYAGSPLPSGDARGVGNSPAVWRLPISQGAAQTRIGDGHLAFWSSGTTELK